MATAKNAAGEEVNPLAPAGEVSTESLATQPDDGPAESKNASVKVACAHPTHRFVVSDEIPVITRTGTMLTKGQAKEALKAAEGCRVRLEVIEGEVN